MISEDETGVSEFTGTRILLNGGFVENWCLPTRSQSHCEARAEPMDTAMLGLFEKGCSRGGAVLLQHVMQSYKQAWETSDEHLLASLFSPDGYYHNTPFAQQRGHTLIKQY